MDSLGDALTAPFHCQFDPFLQDSAHWNKRLGEAFRRSLSHHFFVVSVVIVPFSSNGYMLCLQVYIPETHGILSILETKYAFETTTYQNMALNESELWTHQLTK